MTSPVNGRVGWLESFLHGLPNNLPNDIQMVNRTSVRILSLKIRYTFTVMAMVGMNGSPGVRNARAYLQN